MVYKLRPLELRLDVEDRTYKLGDTINLTVDLVPRGEVDVREGRVDLVCEERFVHVAAPSAAGYASWSGAPVQVGSANVQSSKERVEKHVHSSVVFLKETRLRPGTPGTYTPRLRIQPVPPMHLEDAKALVRDANSSWTFKWRLVASVDVARGPDPRKQRTIKVRLD